MNVAEQIQMCGYAILPELLNRKQVGSALAVVERLWEEEQRENPEFARRHPQYMANNLSVRTRELDAIIEHPQVIEVARRLLGPEFILSEIRACNLSRCEEVPFIHRDGYVRSFPEEPLALLALWTLEEFTRDNGGTLLFPGSHHWPFKPTAENTRLFQHVTVEAPPGSLVLFDANLWHGPSANRSGRSRWSLNAYYVRWFLKPYFDMPARIGHAEFRALSPMMKQLLGFNSQPPSDERSRVRTVVPVEQIEKYHRFSAP